MPKKFAETDFTIGPSTIPEAGQGLFAAKRIEIEDTIGYYTGEIIDLESLNSGTFAGSRYILWVAEKHIIVGEGPKANYTRFINHSNEPNAFLVVSTRWKSARFEAIKVIAPGEEIFFSYGEEYWEEEAPWTESQPTS